MDQALVHAALKDDSVAIMARAMVTLGTHLVLPVVVEGVETQAQRDFFVNLGCTTFQGNFFAPPVLPDEMFEVYKQNMPLVGLKRA